MREEAFVQQSSSDIETRALGEALGRVARAGDVVILSGDLGAGKTQFAKGVAQALGVVEEITSPTFNIMLVYKGAQGQTFNHFDLYRLDNVHQLEDIDYFSHLESDAISIVEWGSRFSDAMPLDYLDVMILLDESSPDARVIQTTPHGAQATRLLAEWRAVVQTKEAYYAAGYEV